MKSKGWHILRCGVCGEEHWHHPNQSEVICLFCELWSENFHNKTLVSLMVIVNHNTVITKKAMNQYGGDFVG